MATYYVDATNGNDSNSGEDPSASKATVDGAEDLSLAAGDIVRVAPGVYRETHLCSNSGTDGSPIAFIGDVTGAYFGVPGGPVRLTGSDNDVDYSRDNVISLGSQNYRTWQGFSIDGARYARVYASGANYTGLSFLDCFFQGSVDLGSPIIDADGVSKFTMKRCIAIAGGSTAIYASPAAPFAGTNNLIENCLFIGSERFSRTIRVNRNDGFNVRASTFIHPYEAIKAENLDANGYTVNVERCLIYGAHYGFVADVIGEIVEDYNWITCTGTNYTNTTPGANTITDKLALFAPWVLSDGVYLPQPSMFAPSQWSDWGAKAGGTAPSADIFGCGRPSTDSKNSWGAIQYNPVERDDSITYGDSVASLKLLDAGNQQMYIPTGNGEITVSVRCYRGNGYTGTSPQMIIRQPGQSDVTVTDSGSAENWNTLQTTITPANQPEYVVVILQSNNTATSGDYAVYFDGLDVQ